MKRVIMNYNYLLKVNCFAIRVTSATGTPIKVLGIIKCPVTLGNKQYIHTFMVCKNIRRSMILEIDFLRKYRIGTNWTEKGQFSNTDSFYGGLLKPSKYIIKDQQLK